MSWNILVFFNGVPKLVSCLVLIFSTFLVLDVIPMLYWVHGLKWNIHSYQIFLIKDEDQESGDFFPAIIAENPKLANKNRYLVFFDDGYASYLHHKDIRIVYEADQDVWKDVDKNVRGFVKEYIQQIPNKFMITLKEGDKVRTELHGKMVEAEVNDIDGSLAQMVFPGDVCEWLYRGSARFEPMAKLKADMETGLSRFSRIH